MIKQYDGAVGPAERLQSAVKMATVISRMPKGSLQDHLLVNSSSIADYDELRREIAEITRAQRHLGAGAEPNWCLLWHGAVLRRPSPMQIGAFHSNAGKGSGKGKGGSPTKCFKRGKLGHLGKDCWSSTKGQQSGKRGGQGQGRGAPKGGGPPVLVFG